MRSRTDGSQREIPKPVRVRALFFFFLSAHDREEETRKPLFRALTKLIPDAPRRDRLLSHLDTYYTI